VLTCYQESGNPGFKKELHESSGDRSASETRLKYMLRWYYLKESRTALLLSGCIVCTECGYRFSVGLCPLATTVNPELSKIQFGLWTWVGPKNRVLVGASILPRKKAILGVVPSPHWNASDCVSTKCHSSTGMQTCPRLQNGLAHRGGAETMQPFVKSLWPLVSIIDGSFIVRRPVM